MKKIFLGFSALSLAACAATPAARHTSSADQPGVVSPQTAPVASGVFRGFLRDQSTGKAMGAMEIDLASVLLPADGGGTGGRSILQGTVRVNTGNQEADAAITQGAFIPTDGSGDSGNLGAFVNVNFGKGGESVASFTLNATLSGDRLSGTIAPTGGLTGMTGTFSLTRNAPPAKGSFPAPVGSRFYAGTYVNTSCQQPQFKNSVFCRGTNPDQSPVTLALNFSAGSAGYAFVNLFADVKTCNVQLNFGQIGITMPTAEFNPATEFLSFTGVASGDVANSTLVCHAQGAGFRCSFRSSASAAEYDFTLTPAASGAAMAR